MEIWWVSWLPSSKWQCLLQLHGSTDHCGFCARARIHRCIVSFECFDVAGRHGYADRWPCSASARKSQLSRWFYAILMFMFNSQWSSTLDVRLCIIKNLLCYIDVLLMFYDSRTARILDMGCQRKEGGTRWPRAPRGPSNISKRPDQWREMGTFW